MNISSNDLRAVIAAANKKASSSNKAISVTYGPLADAFKQANKLSDEIKAVGNTEMFYKNGIATLKSAIDSGTYTPSNEEIADQMIKQSLFNSITTIF